MGIIVTKLAETIDGEMADEYGGVQGPPPPSPLFSVCLYLGLKFKIEVFDVCCVDYRLRSSTVKLRRCSTICKRSVDT